MAKKRLHPGVKEAKAKLLEDIAKLDVKSKNKFLLKEIMKLTKNSDEDKENAQTNIESFFRKRR